MHVELVVVIPDDALRPGVPQWLDCQIRSVPASRCRFQNAPLPPDKPDNTMPLHPSQRPQPQRIIRDYHWDHSDIDWDISRVRSRQRTVQRSVSDPRGVSDPRSVSDQRSLATDQRRVSDQRPGNGGGQDSPASRADTGTGPDCGGVPVITGSADQAWIRSPAAVSAGVSAMYGPGGKSQVRAPAVPQM